MADFIRKNDNLKLHSADIFQKNGLLERHLWVPNTVFTEFKNEKAPAKGAFSAEGILASQ